MNNDDLAPHITAALCDVTPAPDSLRDQHISAAIGQITVTAKRPRSRWLSAAAAIVVLVAGATTAVRLTTSGSDSNVALQSEKTMTATLTKGSAHCGANGDSGMVGDYWLLGQHREIWATKQRLTVYESGSCTQLGEIEHAKVPSSDVACTPALVDASDTIIGGYNMASAYRVLINTPTKILVYSGSSCRLLAWYPQP